MDYRLYRASVETGRIYTVSVVGRGMIWGCFYGSSFIGDTASLRLLKIYLIKKKNPVISIDVESPCPQHIFGLFARRVV